TLRNPLDPGGIWHTRGQISALWECPRQPVPRGCMPRASSRFSIRLPLLQCTASISDDSRHCSTHTKRARAKHWQDQHHGRNNVCYSYATDCACSRAPTATPFSLEGHLLMSTSELACTYAALILHDDGLEITADNMNTILKAANITVEPYWPGLFAKMFATKNIGDLIANVGAGAVRRMRA
ncbi:60S acidic ribosomal protein P1, partial [Haematococcus lacustris]